MLSDIEIAENAELKDIREVAAQLSLKMCIRDRFKITEIINIIESTL